MITLTAPSSVAFDGYQIVSVIADPIGGIATITYRQTLSGAPVDPTGLAVATLKTPLATLDALAGSTTVARASAAVAAALSLAQNAFTIS